MQPVSSRSQATNRAQARVIAAADEQQALMRGLVNGVMLSLVLWTAIGYVAYTLR